MKQVGIFYLSYDGIISCYCGVGVATQTLLKIFPGITKLFKDHNINLNLELISPALIDQALGYDHELLKQSRKLAQGFGGELHLVINGSDGMIPYGDINNWKAVSIAAADRVLSLAHKYEESLVFCVDTPFIYTPYYIDLQKIAFNSPRITSLVVLHSDALIHEGVNASLQRLEWEASAIKYLSLKSDVYFAKTSQFLMNHLSSNYGIASSKFVDLQSGIYPASERYRLLEEKEISKVLRCSDIPLDREIIFSVGRAVEHKGFDILIKAISLLHHDVHLVIIASPYKTEASIVAQLQDLLRETKISCTPIFYLDLNLPQAICQWKNTKIVAQLSRAEPFGLVSEEVRLWARRKGPVILTSNRDGYLEQIEDCSDGFIVDIENVEEVSYKIDSILDLPEGKLCRIRQKGLDRALRDFDFRVSFLRCLKRLTMADIDEDLMRREFNDSLF